MPGLTIRAYNHDTKVPKTGTDTASCHLKSTDLTYPFRIRSGLLPRIEARGYHRSPAISPSHARKDRIARYAHDAGPAGKRLCIRCIVPPRRSSSVRCFGMVRHASLRGDTPYWLAMARYDTPGVRRYASPSPVGEYRTVSICRAMSRRLPGRSRGCGSFFQSIGLHPGRVGA